ncbi:hypothetical protein D3C72_1397930 [compost metagenome]
MSRMGPFHWLKMRLRVMSSTSRRVRLMRLSSCGARAETAKRKPSEARLGGASPRRLSLSKRSLLR